MKTYSHSLWLILIAIALFSIIFHNTITVLAETTKTTRHIDQLFPFDTPPTAREIDSFLTLQKDASVNYMVSIIGKPDEDTGSGIFIFVYNMKDGTKVLIGTHDFNKPPMYIVHILTDGRKEDLIK